MWWSKKKVPMTQDDFIKVIVAHGAEYRMHVDFYDASEKDIAPFLNWNADNQLVATQGPLNRWLKWLWTRRILPCWSMQGVNLQCANLQHADLRGLDLSGANLRGASLQDAKLERVSLIAADLRGAKLCYANLAGADLSAARLNNADLSWACLRRADLFGSNLCGANLSYANLCDAVLGSCTLLQALGVKEVINMPTHFHPGGLAPQWQAHELPGWRA